MKDRTYLIIIFGESMRARLFLSIIFILIFILILPNSYAQSKKGPITLLSDKNEPKELQIGIRGANEVAAHNYLYKGEKRSLGGYTILPTDNNDDGVPEVYSSVIMSESNLHWTSFNSTIQIEKQLIPYQGGFVQYHYADATLLNVGVTYTFNFYAYEEVPAGMIGGRAGIGSNTRYIHIIPYSIPITGATSTNGSFANINFTWSAPSPLYCTIDHYELYRRDADSVRIMELSQAERVVGDIDPSSTSLIFNYGKRNINSFYALVCYDQYGEAIGISRSYQVTLPNSTFSLTSPVDGIISTTLTPMLDWNDYGAGNTYKLTYSENSDFSNSTIITGITQSQYTFSSSLSDHKSYYWKVEVEGQNVVSGQTGWVFFTNSTNQTSSNFALISPSNNSEIDSKRPKLEWEISADYGDKITYNVIIATDNNFNNIVLDDFAYTNYYWVNTELIDDTQYFWKVKATDSQSNSTLGDVRTFTTSYNNFPSNFELTAPLYNSNERPVETGLTPTFTWNSSTDSDPGSTINYILWYSQDPTFATKTEVTGLLATSYTPSVALEEDKQYYWKVFAIDNTGKQTQSAGNAYTFVINAIKSSLTINELRLPINNASVDPENIVFSWSGINTTDIYDQKVYSFYLATDQNFSNIIYSSENLLNTNSVTIPLLEHGLYYWKVNSRIIDIQQNVRVLQESNIYLLQVNESRITINYPITSSSVYTSNVYTINWNTNYTSTTVKIEFSNDGGANWILLTDNYQNSEKKYVWSIPDNVASNNCFIRITDKNSLIIGISNIFSITNTVANDNSHVLYFISDNHTKIKKLNSSGITTIANGYFANIAVDYSNQKIAYTVGNNIYLMKTDGTDIHQIASNIYGLGYIKWMKDNIHLLFYGTNIDMWYKYGIHKINIITGVITRLYESHGAIYDWDNSFEKYAFSTENNNFYNADFNNESFSFSNEIQINNSGENIVWSSLSSDGSFQIFAVRQNNADVIYKSNFKSSSKTQLKKYNSTTSYGKIYPGSNSIYLSDITNAGIYAISEMNIDGSSYLSKVTSLQTFGAFDIGNHYSNTILSLTSPIGSETLVVSNSTIIKWDSQNVENIKIEYSADGGTSWNLVAETTPAYLGGYLWLVPNNVSNHCKVRISDSSNDSNISTSANNFQIVSPSIQLTYPVEGETLESGKDYQISWSAVAVLNVDIYYSTDNGSNWDLLVSGLNGSSSQYNWTVPNLNSKQCKIKLNGSGYNSTSAINQNSFTISPLFHLTDLLTNLPPIEPHINYDPKWGDFDNDSDLDVLIYPKLYRNDNGTFTEISLNQDVLEGGKSSWCDYDNDGFLDFAVTGISYYVRPDGSNYNGSSQTYVFHNDGGTGSFTLTNSLDCVTFGAVEWFDYNNDGYMDLMVTGKVYGGRNTSLYKNDKGHFTLTSISFGDISKGYWTSKISPGDINNDGYTDIILDNRVFKQDNGIFNDLGIDLGIPPLFSFINSSWTDLNDDGSLDIFSRDNLYMNNNGSFLQINNDINGFVTYADYNNDGKIDIFKNTEWGRNDGSSFTYFDNNSNYLPMIPVDYNNDGKLEFQANDPSKIFLNNCPSVNTAPSKPTNLTVVSGNPNQVKLCWNAATDNETPAANLTYNVIVGSSPGAYDIISPMSDLTTGFRRIPRRGNTDHTLFKLLNNLKPGTYYWSVQAIDNNYLGGPFSGEKKFVIGYQNKIINLQKGWNLVSVPVLADTMDSKKLFYSADSFLFGFNREYEIAYTLKIGKGYWVNYPASVGVTIYGRLIDSNKVIVKQGWNLIGSYTKNINVSNISSLPEGMINSLFYTYNDGYKNVDSLESGKGYWVKVNQDGFITLGVNAGSINKITGSESVQNIKNQIKVTDSFGRMNQLYLSETGIGLDKYELPPSPPEGIFDVRWATNSLVVGNGTNELLIHSAEYPVSINVSGCDIKIRDKINGRIINHIIRNGQSFIVSNKNIDRLEISRVEVPAKFELYQNYPNPFNPTTVIGYQIPEAGRVTLKVFDILGREVATLVDEIQQAGYYTSSFSTLNSSFSSGTYFYQIKAGGFTQTKKLLLLK